MQEYLEANRGLIDGLAKKYLRPGEEEDLYQIARIAVAKAIRSHDPSKSKLSTWVYIQVRGAVAAHTQQVDTRRSREYSDQVKGAEGESCSVYEITPSDIPDPEQIFVKAETDAARATFWELVKQDLSPRQAQALDMWLAGATDVKVAKTLLGVTRQRALQIRNSIMKKARRVAIRNNMVDLLVA